MDERELSKLSYLVQALVRAPDRYSDVLELAEGDHLKRPSDDFKKALAVLKKIFASATASRKPSTSHLKDEALKLIESGDAPSVSAGRSLAWALESRAAATASTG